MGKLSEELLVLGFFSALGTTQHRLGGKAENYVGRGTPLTWDTNNGILVIYDEEGRPWIRRRDYGAELGKVVNDLVVDRRVTRGAYVPHSNDGGHFVYEVLPTL